MMQTNASKCWDLGINCTIFNSDCRKHNWFQNECNKNEKPNANPLKSLQKHQSVYISQKRKMSGFLPQDLIYVNKHL